MQTFTHYALPAAIAASALGAIALCTILLLYGFARAADDEPRFPSRRLFVIRFGLALAVSCFAVVVMLTSLALLDDRRATTAPEVAPRAAADESALETRISALERRLESVEQRASAPATVASARSHPAPRRSAAVDRTRRAAPQDVTAPPSRGAGESPVHGAATADAPPPSPAPDSGSMDTEQMKRDWEAVKRDFRTTGKEIQAAFHDLGRRIKQGFGSSAP